MSEASAARSAPRASGKPAAQASKDISKRNSRTISVVASGPGRDANPAAGALLRGSLTVPDRCARLAPGIHAHRAVLKLRNLAERVEHRVRKQVRCGFVVAER